MHRTAPCLLLAALAACAPSGTGPTRPPAGPGPSIVETDSGITFRLQDDTQGVERVVAAPVDRVRAALPEVYAQLGITGAGTDPANGVFGSPKVTAARLDGERTSVYVRCGNDGAGPSAGMGYRIQLSVLTSLAEEGSRTRVTTRVGGFGSPVGGSGSGAVLCVSNGRLEARLAELLTARLRA